MVNANIEAKIYYLRIQNIKLLNYFKDGILSSMYVY